MRRYLVASLVIADLALAGGLAWQWITPQGQIRGVQWSPPAPIRPVYPDVLAPSWSADLGSFMAALDRPLFAMTRKPPPKPEVAAAVVADTLADVRVLGLYSSGGSSGGAIVRAAGKVRRVRPGDALGGWTVKEIHPLELVLVRGGEKRALDVKRGPDLAPDVAGEAGAAPAAPGSSSVSAGGDLVKRQQQEAFESTARVNAMRARSGLPPLP
ncbi:MAG: hypothetical protein NVS3B2_01140 [Ramlibacter sp.]